MCNPRRVQVRISQELNESWEQAVERVVELSEEVIGEARTCQPVGETIAAPALRALEAALATGDSGWREVEGGYRVDVEGGYAVYRTAERELEIVATAQGLTSAVGRATSTLRGTVTGELTTDAVGNYYDDGWGGRTREAAEQEAQAAGAKELERQRAGRLRQAADEAERASASAVEEEARREAQRQLDLRLRHDREALTRRAREHLEEVGASCRRAFNSLLARGYKDAILAYARQHGASGIECRDEGGTVEIEFRISG